jgi:probable aminopeptidase NPEPL1
MLSGKTVEINNTDAEGRLVLADGCFFAANTKNPLVIIDIATLTGAQLITTGKKHASIYCNEDELEALAVQEGKYTGELVYPFHTVQSSIKLNSGPS